jgi:hypothetical protein
MKLKIQMRIHAVAALAVLAVALVTPAFAQQAGHAAAAKSQSQPQSQSTAAGANPLPAIEHSKNFDQNIQPVLPQGFDQHHEFIQPNPNQDRRGIGIAPQSSEPTIAPQYNEPMIGQQGPPPFQTGLPGNFDSTRRHPAWDQFANFSGATRFDFYREARRHHLAPGVQPGLSDRGIIWPAPGTVAVGPQDDDSENNWDRSEAYRDRLQRMVNRRGENNDSHWNRDGRHSTQTAAINNDNFNQNIQPVLPQGFDEHHEFIEHPTTQDRRGIGIGPQTSAPVIAPQYNEPMIGQQGPPAMQPGLPQNALPPGVRPGLSDQGPIFPAPGTIVVGPQGVVQTPQSGGVPGRQNFGPAIGRQGFGTAIAPNNISPAVTPQSVQPQLPPQNVTRPNPAVTPQQPALTPTGR